MLLKKLNAVVAALEKNKNITIGKHEVQKKASASLLSELAKKHGIDVETLALWGECDGFELAWEATGGDVEAKGGIEIRSIETVLGSWDGRVYFDDTPEKDPKRTFHPIDSYDGDYGSGQYAGLQLGGHGKPRIQYLDSDLELSDLAKDLPAYIELFAATRGLVYWQSEILRLRTSEEGGSDFDDFKSLFPDLDLNTAARRA